MKIEKEFILREIAGDYLLVPVGKAASEFNGMININETGAFLFKLLQEDVSIEQLVEALCQEFEVDQRQAKEDVYSFVQSLKKYRII